MKVEKKDVRLTLVFAQELEFVQRKPLPDQSAINDRYRTAIKRSYLPRSLSIPEPNEKQNASRTVRHTTLLPLDGFWYIGVILFIHDSRPPWVCL